MRILLVNHEFSATGASNGLLRLYQRLKADGHALDVCALNPAPGQISEAYGAEQARIVTQVSPGAYDVCIANTVAAAGFVNQIGPSVPTIWWLHEAEVGLAMLLRDVSQLAAFQRAQAVVFQTAFQRDAVYRSFTFALDPDKLHVIPNGASVEDRVKADQLPAKAAPIRIVSVGTVYPRKRFSDVVQAVARVRARLDVELVICGGLQGGLDAQAQRIIAAEPARFHITGEISRVESQGWIASGDVYCLASDSESQAVSVLEAGLLSKPCVLSALACYEGRYRHGQNCLLFPVGDVELLSHLLALLAADPVRRTRLGEAAFDTARRFSEAAFQARFLVLLGEVAGSRR